MARRVKKTPSNHFQAIRFDKHLKSEGLKNAYVIVGPETYLCREVCLKIRRAAFDGEIDSPSYSEYDASKADLANILDDARTMPFFGHGHRVVVVTKAEALFEPAKSNASKEQAAARDRQIDAILSYMAKPVSTSTLILTMESLDKRRKESKKVLAHDPVILCDMPTPAALRSWVEDQANDPPFESGAAEMLIERCAGGQIGLGQLASEVAKLQNSARGQKKITKAQVEALITKSTNDSFFDLLSTINSGHVGRAIAMTHQILKDGAAEKSGKRVRDASAMTSMAIGAFTYDLRRLWKARSHLDSGKRGHDLKSAIGGGWKVDEVIRRAQKSTSQTLESRHKALQRADRDIRSGIPASESLLTLVTTMATIAESEKKSR